MSSLPRGTAGRELNQLCLNAGRDFSHDDTLDVPIQVELLIKQATSHENLCQCYIGWSVITLLPHLSFPVLPE